MWINIREFLSIDTAPLWDRDIPFGPIAIVQSAGRLQF